MTINIIGAGIGGLTTAIALQQKGIKTRIFEQAKVLKPVGAGILLANNAMQVYDKLGLRAAIEAGGNYVKSLNVTDAQLNVLSGIELKYFEEQYKVRNVSIHRGKLQEILLKQLYPDTIFLAHGLKTLKKDAVTSRLSRDEIGYFMNFENGTSKTGQYIIGADGLNSKVRQFLFKDSKIRSTHQVCWRGVADFELPQQYQHEVNEAWGKGDRVGFMKIAPKKVYWFALKTFKQTAAEYPLAGIADYFKAYHPLAQNLIQSTPIDTIHTAIIEDLKPLKNWYEYNICLIGDAGHATTPNLGQGAGQAIEDAYILAECIAKYETVHQAYAHFQQLRQAKVNQIVQSSWAIGQIAHWKNSIATRLRNQLVKMTPNSINQKQLKQVFELAKVG